MDGGIAVVGLSALVLRSLVRPLAALLLGLALAWGPAAAAGADVGGSMAAPAARVIVAEPSPSPTPTVSERASTRTIVIGIVALVSVAFLGGVLLLRNRPLP